MAHSIIAEDLVRGDGCQIGAFNIIEPGVRLGNNVRIGNYCRLHSGVVIGDDTVVLDYVELRQGTIVGRNCYIDSRVSSSGDVILEDEVTVRYDAILARGLRVGAKTYICPRVMTNNLDTEHRQIGGAQVGERAFIGTNAVLHHGITVGDEVTIGSLAFVNCDCEPGGVYVGTPAKRIR